MLSFSDCKLIIDNKINDLTFIGYKPEELYQPISYILKLGGKRLRPVMALMACNIFDNEIEYAVNPALAIEIFHNFTLLHDDIMDKAPMRRGNPTVHHKWNDNIAILSGDAMNILAYQYLCNTKSEYLPQLLEIFSQTALEICEGQQMDMNFETRNDVSLKEYLEMIRLKTAVLIAASLKIGAICGGASQASGKLLYEFGLNLGLAFQIQDDLLDAFGNEEEFGKSIGGDIVAGKKTFLYLKALEIASSEQKEELLSLYNLNSSDAPKKVEAVQCIFKNLGISDIAEETVAHYTGNAMKSLAEVSEINSTKALERLAYHIMSRKN